MIRLLFCVASFLLASDSVSGTELFKLRGHEPSPDETGGSRRVRVGKTQWDLSSQHNEHCATQSSLPLGSSGRTTLGRTGLVFNPSTCSTQHSYPGVFGSLERYYEEVGPFSHPIETCVSVKVDAGTCMWQGHILVYVTAYTSFDPLDMSAGYLGGVGDPEDFNIFQFQLPADTPFYVVGQQILTVDYNLPKGYQGTAPNGNGCTFSVAIEFGEGSCEPSHEDNSLPSAATVPAPPTIHLDECIEYSSLPMGSSLQTVKGGVRDFYPSSCVDLNLFPGQKGRPSLFFEEIGPFVNPSNVEHCCVTVNVNAGNCIHQDRVLVHVSAYLDAFNRLDQDDKFVGGIGDPQLYTNFSFALPPGRAFYLVGRQVPGGPSEHCVFAVQTNMTQKCSS